jgi:hypothetical protein
MRHLAGTLGEDGGFGDSTPFLEVEVANDHLTTIRNTEHKVWHAPIGSPAGTNAY